jgi:hypothetical protein
MTSWRTTNNRRRIKRYRPWLKWKLTRLMADELSRMIENFILHGDPRGPKLPKKLFADGGPIHSTEISLVDYPSYRWGGGPEFVMVKDEQ